MEAEPAATVTASYLIKTPGRDVVVDQVADVNVGPQGELVLADDAGACLGIFAPGEWRFVQAVATLAEDEAGA